MVNINAMRAIVKHKVFKQQKQLTKSKKNDFIQRSSLDKLKKKGLSSEIVSKFKKAKPKRGFRKIYLVE